MFNISLEDIKAAPQVKVIVGNNPTDLEEKINAFYTETYEDYAIVNVDYEVPEKSFDTLQHIFAFITYVRITEEPEEAEGGEGGGQ